MSDSERFKCDICGKFVSLGDLEVGAASRSCVSVDSEFTSEDYETLCRDHSKEGAKNE